MSAAPTTSSCAETPSGTYCVPPCAYPCFDDYLFTVTPPCDTRDWGCMCGRPSSYKNTACCFAAACPAAENATAAAFEREFCATFNFSASYPASVDCRNWTAPPVPSKPSTTPQDAVATSNAAAIGGGVGGGVAGLIVVSLGSYFLWRRHARRRSIGRTRHVRNEAVDDTPELEAKDLTGGDGRPELGGVELRELGDTQLPTEMEAMVTSHPNSPRRAHYLYELGT